MCIPDEKSPWRRYTTGIMKKLRGRIFRRFRVIKGPPVIQKTISAKKWYTLTPLFPTISGYLGAPSFRNHFSQKTVHLNTSISDNFGLLRSPVIQKNHFSQKTVYLYRSTRQWSGRKLLPLIAARASDITCCNRVVRLLLSPF